MFGMSLPKLVVLIVIVVAVWYGFRWMNRRNQVRDGKEERGRLDAAAGTAENTVRCVRCDTFVPAQGARHCGRDGCPYPR